MHQNRIILILGILVALIPLSGFPPEAKKYVIVFAGLIIALLAILVERHIKIPLHWRKKPTVTEAASTYVEHNGAVSIK